MYVYTYVYMCYGYMFQCALCARACVYVRYLYVCISVFTYVCLCVLLSLVCKYVSLQFNPCYVVHVWQTWEVWWQNTSYDNTSLIFSSFLFSCSWYPNMYMFTFVCLCLFMCFCYMYMCIYYMYCMSMYVCTYTFLFSINRVMLYMCGRHEKYGGSTLHIT